MVLTMLSLLATTTVVSGAESLSSCQIPPDQLQRSWFGVTSAMSKPVVLTDQFATTAIGQPAQIAGCDYRSSPELRGSAQIGAQS